MSTPRGAHIKLLFEKMRKKGCRIGIKTLYMRNIQNENCHIQRFFTLMRQSFYSRANSRGPELNVLLQTDQ